MSFAIKHGLFKLSIIDHHAILGVSLDADPKQIRLRYLKIAQQLHPDTYKADPAKKQLAGQILSKLVNPAYEELSRKNSFAEHQLVLTQIGKRLAENKDKITTENSSVQELLTSGDRLELVYPSLLKNLIAAQYQSLEQAMNKVGRISELNMVYLMLKCDKAIAFDREINRKNQLSPRKSATVSKPTVSQAYQTQVQPSKVQSSPVTTKTESEEPTPQSRVASFVGRAHQYIVKGDYDQAITELRDALKIDPNNSTTHALMGSAYLRKKQLTMAKVHIDKAYQANPNDPRTIESKKELEKMTKIVNKSKTSSPNSTSKPENKSGNSGFFSGFFGAKKK